jgi:tetratricopeptide (TPR) repeat protein
MAELDPAELATVLDSADRYLSNHDWQAAHDLLHPLLAANVATGTDLGRLNFALGEACMGLQSFDAAWEHYQVALGLQTGDDRQMTELRIGELQVHYQGLESTTDGVAGENEADTVLFNADGAFHRRDIEGARALYRQAWEGIQMTDVQISTAALGLARCAIALGELDEADGYLQVAEARSPHHTQAIADLRQDLAARRAGATLGDDGVQMTELDEINQSALQASWDGDYASAQSLFEQMLASDVLPATDRGRIHRNVGVMQIYLHDYEGARASFQEAVRVGTPDVQSMAQASLAQLDANASAADIVAGIDLSAN